MELKFKLGDRVSRSGGSYCFPGTVVGAYRSEDGYPRYSVSLAGLKILHIFRETDLSPMSEAEFALVESLMLDVVHLCKS